MLCLDLNNSKEDHPPLCPHICLMSTQNGWLPLAKKLLMIFFPGAIQQPQRPTLHAEERPIELPNSEKVHAWHIAVTVILCLLVLICYFCLFLG